MIITAVGMERLPTNHPHKRIILKSISVPLRRRLVVEYALLIK